MRHTICIDIQVYDSVLSRVELGLIGARIAEHTQSVTISELADAITSGYSWCPATFSNNIRRAKNWLAQSVFVAEVLKEDSTLEDIIQTCQGANIKASLIMGYEDRFIVVFQSNKKFTDAASALCIARKLSQELITCGSTVDFTKVYPGGGDILYTDFDSYIDADSFNYEVYEVKPADGMAKGIGVLDYYDVKLSNSRKANVAKRYATAVLCDKSVAHHSRVFTATLKLAASGCFCADEILYVVRNAQKYAGDFKEFRGNVTEIVLSAIDWFEAKNN